MNEWHTHGFHIDTIYDDGTAARIQKNEKKFQNCTNQPRKRQAVNKELIRKIRHLFNEPQINKNAILQDFIKINTAKLVTPYDE